MLIVYFVTHRRFPVALASVLRGRDLTSIFSVQQRARIVHAILQAKAADQRAESMRAPPTPGSVRSGREPSMLRKSSTATGGAKVIPPSGAAGTATALDSGLPLTDALSDSDDDDVWQESEFGPPRPASSR